MSSHLRYCPKHRKPPCPHCALTAKPAVTVLDGPEEIPAANPEVSALMPNVPVTEPEIPNVIPEPSTAAPIPKQSFLTPRHWIPDMPGPYCLRHGKKRPCPGCQEISYEETKWTQSVDEYVGGDLFEKWTASVTPAFHGKWVKSAKKAKLRIPEVTITNPNYDPEQFRKEIDMGLIYTKRVLRDFPSYLTVEDLKQITELEVWVASQHYAEKMNGAIAYTIAKYQGKRFLKNQIEEQTIAVENPDGSVALDEFGKPMKIPRFLSFDDKGIEEDGSPRETSLAEESIVLKARPDARHNGQALIQIEEKKAWVDDIRSKIPVLEKLVSGWFGTKRIVGDILLKNPEATVRDFPGVPKSTAARVRQAVLAEFRAVVDSPLDERRVA